MTASFRTIILLPLVFSMLAANSTSFAQGVTAEVALKYKPVQKYVEYDTPSQSEFSQCEVKVVQEKTGSGWVVRGPQGEILRKFMDTDRDNTVDRWSYFRGGIEVYRDQDTNDNKKVDQSRWLNTGGTRWGIDQDEDGTIDGWRQMSVEELCELTFYALKTKDTKLLQSLMVSSTDLKNLGVRPDLVREILSETGELDSKIRQVTSGGQITSSTEWLRYDAGLPGVIPVDDEKAKQELQVYENTRALMENDGKVDLLQIGELVLVGKTWKLASFPRPINQDSGPIEFGGILLRPSQTASSGEVMAPTANSEEARALLDELQELDENSPRLEDGVEALGAYNKKRADILQKLVSISETPEERELWLKQLVDGITAAVQVGAYKEGVQRLKSFEDSLKSRSPESDLVPYVTYRRLTSEYSTRATSTAPEEQEELQKWWLTSLEEFVEKYPKSEEAADAAFQIASSYEISGREDDARTWYQRIVSSYGKTIHGQKARGALRRMGLEGEVLEFSGKTLTGQTLDLSRYRGRVVVLTYWATWSRPFLEDLPQLQALSKEYRSKGFEIVGVNVDLVSDGLSKFTKEQGINFPSIHEEGGLDSPPAVKLGILMPPVMILIDQQGKVISTQATIEMLKEKVPALLK
ncbi:MAG: redoxin domain-containing protein [Planctomycetaceae bacterium]|nr:redoxin domain-containing protein [Planctomycetaceae bacterium]